MRNRLLASTMALALLVASPLAVCANELSNSTWSETDASNTSPAPNGWPAGMLPNQVEPAAQAMMGALKRFWDRINPVITTTGTAPHYIYTPTNVNFPAAWQAGETFAWIANFDSAGNDDLNVMGNGGGGLGAIPLYKPTSSGMAKVAAGDIKNGQTVVVSYNAALNAGNGGLAITSVLPVSTGFVGGALSATTSMNGAAFNMARTTIASAATTNIGAANANVLSVSGTTTINAFDTVQAGTQRVLIFQGVLTLTYNGTSMVLPGGVSVATAAGDVGIFESEGSGNWICIGYVRKDGSSLQQIANNRVMGNVSGGSGPIVVLTQAQLTALINSFTNSLAGAVPASGGGTTNFLRADQTWAAPSASGVPTSRKINTAARLSGGGDLTADRTIDMASGIGPGSLSCSATNYINTLTVDTYGRVTGATCSTTCFLLSSPVTMADGRKRALGDVRIGEKVSDGCGGFNVVVALDRTKLGERHMVLINKEHWTSAEHPHMRPDRSFAAADVAAIYAEWDALHPVIVKGGTIERRHNVGLAAGSVTEMAVGQKLLKETGPVELVELRNAKPHEFAQDTPLGNLVLSGSGTYVVDGYVVTGWPNHKLFDHKAWKPMELAA